MLSHEKNKAFFASKSSLILTVAAKHDLTLFQRCRNVSLLLQGEGQEGEVGYPHPVLLNGAT
jgi:hypothetical protein